MTNADKLPEPWLRGTLSETPAVLRAVLHALQAADEDIVRWCGSLTDEEINERPAGLPSVASQLRHIARSVDRLLTYAEGRDLSGEQLQSLKSEAEPEAKADAALAELAAALHECGARVRRFDPAEFEQPANRGTAPPTYDDGRFARTCCRSHSAPRRTGDHDSKDTDR
jgi:uncharacterized damage-inducible protein DinB